MKKVLNIIFILTFVAGLLGFTILDTTRTVLNNNTSTTKRSELSTFGVGALYDIKGEDKLVTYSEIMNIDSVNPEIAHRYLDEDLKKQGIPIEALDYVLKEDDYQGMYYEYRASAIGYLKGENEKPKLDIPRILGMVDRGLTKYNEEKNDDLPVEDIKNDTNVVAQGIDTKIETLKNNKVVTSGVKVATSNKLYYGSIALIVISAIALLIINGIVKGLQNIGIGFIISGILSLICSILLNTNILVLDKLKDLASMIIKYISNKTLTLGIIYIVVGIFLIVITIIITNSKTKKDKIKETNDNDDDKEEKKEEKKSKKSEKYLFFFYYC